MTLSVERRMASSESLLLGENQDELVVVALDRPGVVDGDENGEEDEEKKEDKRDDELDRPVRGPDDVVDDAVVRTARDGEA